MAKLEELLVWQKSMELARDVHMLCKKNEYLCQDYGMCDQLRRSSVSIPSNIAEGVGRGGKKEILRFLIIARGSATELKTQVQLCVLYPYIDQCIADDIVGKIVIIIKMINGMINKLSISND